MKLEPGAELALSVREQADGSGYRFIVRPGRQQIGIATPAGEWTRDHCALDVSQPIKVQVYIVGTVMECFVNDSYALTRRVYDRWDGKLGLTATGGGVQVLKLQVRAGG
ncbi:MAG: GH32 C-terminal domain-containing protein [Armatimonadetes bacterium]|nr:GH32 C-terminal domain-containing protein [Armatimonadota bacterium]